MRRKALTALCCLVLPIALLSGCNGQSIYRNLNGVCGETGKRLSDREFILKGIRQARAGRTDVKLSVNDQRLDANGQYIIDNVSKRTYEDFYDKNSNCCIVLKGYDIEKPTQVGLNEEMRETSVFDRFGGYGYAIVKIDPRSVLVEKPFWNKELNYVDVYLNTCGGSGAEFDVRRGGDG